MKLLVLVSLAAVAFIFPLSAQAADSWNPTVGNGGSGSSGQAGCRSSNCGSVNGQIVWFDVGNLDNNRIDWPRPFLNSQRTAILERRKSPSQVSIELSRNPDNSNFNFRDVLWTNTCFDGGASDVDQFQYTPPGASSSITACRSSSSYNASTREGFRRWNELHTSNPEGEGAAPVLGQIVGWNISVWREGRATPIFERRIGLWTDNRGDDDPLGLSGDHHLKWWYGGNTTDPGADCTAAARSSYWNAGGGGRVSGCKRAAGPLGPITDGDRDRCRAHLNTANSTSRRFTNQTDVYGEGPYSYTNAAYADPDRLGRNTCYWNIGDTRNSGEALRVTWSSSGDKSSINYKLQGRPGFFYAVRITSIDAREQLMGQRRTASNAPFLHGANNSNYFRVFMPGGRPPQTICRPGTGDPACPPPTTPTPPTPPTPQEPENPNQSEPPEPIVNLNVASAVPTRVQELAEVSVSTYTLDEGQALFPTITRLLHFTPQMRYNGARSPNSYGREYVNYDSDTGQRIAPPGAAGATPVPVTAARLQQPAYLGRAVDPTQLSANDFGVSWLRPTLENPCNVAVQMNNVGSSSQQGAWPVPATNCFYPGESVARNVWDDYLEASVIYETRWLAAGSYDNPTGWISDQPLRCYNQPGAPAVRTEDCQARHSLESYSGSASDREGRALGSTQRVQSYARVAPTPGNQRAALGVKLNTNRPDLLTDVRIWERSTLQESDEFGQAFLRRAMTHGLSQDQWLWFCHNGIPASANLDLGTASAADDRTVADANAEPGPYRSRMIMDAKGYAQACAGYTTRWQWNTPSTDWTQPWGDCAYNTPARRATTFPRPNDGSFAGQASVWGRYSEDETWAFAYPGNDLRPLLNGTVPYEGPRPGRPSSDGSNTFSQGCRKEFTGRYYQGGWVRDRVEQRQTGTRRVQVGSNPTFGYVARFNASHTSGPTSRYVGGPRAGEETGGHCSAVHPAPLSRNRCVPYYHNYFVWTRTGATPVFEDQPVYTPYNIYQYRWNGGEGNCFPTQPNPENRPVLRIVSSPNDTTYAPPLPRAPAGERVIEDPNYDPFSPSNWYCNRTVGDGVSYVTTGQWELAHAAGPGWGKRQNGPRLVGGEYSVEWTYGGVNPSAANEVNWSLHGTYIGHTRWQWMSQTLNSNDSVEDKVGHTVAAYGTRTSR